MPKPKGQKRKPAKQVPVKMLTELEQIRVLADPLRVRILEVLCLEERTTKQVAEKIGEKPTKLYHHVEALERVGLIRLSRTRRNRGTLEKYYFGVARRFEADPGLFTHESSAEQKAALPPLIAMMLEKTGEELQRLLGSEVGTDEKEKAILSLVEIHASQREIDRLRRRIERLLADLSREPAAKPDPTDRRYRLTLAYFPLDLPEKPD